MIVSASIVKALPRAAATVLSLLAPGIFLSGCADMSDGMTTAFADPAKYELYDCKQLATERKTLANRALAAIARQVQSFATNSAGAPRKIEAGVFIFDHENSLRQVERS